jgi:dihydrofolate synthase/folylpolyglutamate synthase
MRIVRYTSQNFDLDRMRTLLRKLGNPHEHFRSVHVAGTKGKGSTCAMIAAMLEGNGYKVGLYTSPHLVDIRERIQINGEMIPQEQFARLVKLVEPMVTRARPTPSYFDVLTAVAFKYFAEQKVDIAVIETGLGGRLDSTNVVKPEVTAITNISKDHMAQLGNTVEKIAEEKAGIFKHGIPAVTVMQPPEVEAVLKRVAEKVGAPLDIAGKSIEFSYRFESSRMLGPHNRVCLTTPNSKFEHLAVPLLGEHQALNCGLALSVIDRLKTRGLALNDARSMEGLLKTKIAGRMEMLLQNPRVLVDGAHNAASLDAMMRAIGQHIPYDSMVVIFGCCGDKDVAGMLERITSGADKVIFTNVNNVRTADPEELAARYVEQYGKMAQVAPTLAGALEIANRAVTKEDLICITGSFYLVGEAKKLFASNLAPVRPV